MNQPSLPSEILQLPVSERVHLVEQIWDSIVEDETKFELTAAQKAELDRRLASHMEKPECGVSWDAIKAKLLGN